MRESSLVKPPQRTLRAYETYRSAINRHLKPQLGAIRLQGLRALDVEPFHADLGLSPATGTKHHAILSTALKAAFRADLLQRNVATLAVNKARVSEGHADVLDNVWDGHEARRFLETAKAAGPQPARSTRWLWTVACGSPNCADSSGLIWTRRAASPSIGNS